MKAAIATKHVHPDTIRAGIISSLILLIAYLRVTGISGLLTAVLFMAAVAVCCTLMLKALSDMLVWSFALTAKGCGQGLGYLFGFSLRAYRKLRNAL